MSSSMCNYCGKFSAEHRSKEVSYSYKGRDLLLMQPGVWCSSCGEGVLDYDDLKATEESLYKLIEEVDNGRC